MTTIYHGTPMTPRAALEAMAGRSFCVSYYRPDDDATVTRISDDIMLDNGAFSFWNAAKKEGCEADEKNRDWRPFYDWAGARQLPGRWAVIPDVIGAPSQINDGLLNEWPHGPVFGAPVWHMDGPLNRLPRLADRYDRVCLGWVGGFCNGVPIPSEKQVGCDAYRRRMDEVAAMLGNRWPRLHMLRGVAVAFDYPFRKRGQHQFGAERPPARQPHRHPTRRPMARPTRLCRSLGRKAA